MAAGAPVDSACGTTPTTMASGAAYHSAGSQQQHPQADHLSNGHGGHSEHVPNGHPETPNSSPAEYKMPNLQTFKQEEIDPDTNF